MILFPFSLAALFFLNDPLDDLLEHLVGLRTYDQVMIGKDECRTSGGYKY